MSGKTSLCRTPPRRRTSPYTTSRLWRRGNKTLVCWLTRCISSHFCGDMPSIWTSILMERCGNSLPNREKETASGSTIHPPSLLDLSGFSGWLVSLMVLLGGLVVGAFLLQSSDLRLWWTGATEPPVAADPEEAGLLPDGGGASGRAAGRGAGTRRDGLDRATGHG